MRKGSLNNQIVDLAKNEFPTLEQIGSLVLESVRVEIGDDCLKIIPEFTKTIRSSDHEKVADSSNLSKNISNQTPSVPAGPCLYPLQKTKKRERQCQNRLTKKVKPTLLSDKHTELLAELKLNANPTRNDKTENCEQQLPKRSKGWSEFGSKIKTKDNNDIKYLRKRLNGRVSDIVMKIEPHKLPSNSVGYRWHRDFDSTDDENIWERIGSIFSGSDRSSTRSNNPSVSSGDYCIHN